MRVPLPGRVHLLHRRGLVGSERGGVRRQPVHASLDCGDVLRPLRARPARHHELVGAFVDEVVDDVAGAGATTTRAAASGAAGTALASRRAAAVIAMRIAAGIDRIHGPSGTASAAVAAADASMGVLGQRCCHAATTAGERIHRAALSRRSARRRRRRRTRPGSSSPSTDSHPACSSPRAPVAAPLPGASRRHRRTHGSSWEPSQRHSSLQPLLR